ncbi:MAG: hypothetical protein R3C18_03205 [Planctomycetaceae bacterium]
MIADSFKFKGHPCFKNEWSGFDAFKPITVIIGRNNTGKSQLLDVLDLLTKTELSAIPYEIEGTGILDRESLLKEFPERQWGGDIGGSGDHWKDHGRLLEGRGIEWRRGVRGIEFTVKNENGDRTPTNQWNVAYRRRLSSIVTGTKVRILGRFVRRLLADRDMQPEPENRKLELSTDGTGGTNIIRRFINSSDAAMREELIQKDLLTALQVIFGEDARFNGIEVREDEDNEKWEVYLREPSKGLVPLRSSGSGLKTVILVLLNLLIVPELESQDKSKLVLPGIL